MGLVTVTTQDDIGFITLNNERKKNALSEPLIHEIIAAFSDFKKRGITSGDPASPTRSPGLVGRATT